jgi:hypothetical protein
MSLEIAVYFSGRVFNSDFFKTIESLKYNDTYTIKFFASINENEEDIDPCSDLFLKEIDAIVNYEKLDINITDPYLKFPKRPESNIYNTLSMFYHNKKAFELIEKYQTDNKMYFNFIVKYRGDIITDNNIISVIDKNFIENNYIIELNKLYLPSFSMAVDNNYNDQFCFGDYKSMKYYSECIDKIYEYLSKDKVIINPEIILTHHIKKNKYMSLCFFDFNYSLSPSRHTHSFYRSRK